MVVKKVCKYEKRFDMTACISILFRKERVWETSFTRIGGGTMR